MRSRVERSKREMLDLLPALRGQVFAMRTTPDEHDKQVATCNVSVAEFKPLGHATCHMAREAVGDFLDHAT